MTRLKAKKPVSKIYLLIRRIRRLARANRLSLTLSQCQALEQQNPTTVTQNHFLFFFFTDMASVLGTSSTAILASRSLSSSKPSLPSLSLCNSGTFFLLLCSKFKVQPTNGSLNRKIGLSYVKRAYVGIGVQGKGKGRSHFAVTNVATEINPVQQVCFRSLLVYVCVYVSM